MSPRCCIRPLINQCLLRSHSVHLRQPRFFSLLEDYLPSVVIYTGKGIWKAITCMDLSIDKVEVGGYGRSRVGEGGGVAVPIVFMWRFLSWRENNPGVM